MAAERFCPRCGVDAHMELEVQAFHAPALRSARNWILAVGVLYALGGLLFVAIGRELLDDRGVAIVLGTHLALTAIHVGLWGWAKSAPYAAAVVALVLFVTVQLANALLDPTSIAKGIIVKILFVVALVKALKAGHRAHELRRRGPAA